MQRFLAEGEALQQVAVMGLRAPDGSVAENVPLYRIIPAKEDVYKRQAADSIRSAQAALSVYTAEAREVGAGFCGNSNSRRAGNAQACAGA